MFDVVFLVVYDGRKDSKSLLAIEMTRDCMWHGMQMSNVATNTTTAPCVTRDNLP